MKRRQLNPLTNLYDQNNVTDRRLRRDLSLFTYAVTLGTVYFAISQGTPFTGFASALGADDFEFSVLLAVPVAVSFLQFFASWLMEKTRKRKFIFILSGIIQRALWIPVAMVPLFVPMDRPVLRLWLVISLISLSSVASMFMNVTFYSWLGDTVPLPIRGRYLGIRYSISTAMGLVSALVASAVLDLVPGLDGYSYVFATVAVFGVADIVLFLWIRDPEMHVAEHEPFRKSISGIFKDRRFLLYLLFWTAWIFSWNLPGPFYGKYALEKLGLSISMTTLAGQVASGVMAALFVQWWGRRLDLHGHHWVLVRCCLILCFLPLVWLFASPGSFWPMLVSATGTGIFMCGIDVTSVQMLVTVTPQRNRSVFIAMYMVITSIVGGSLANLTGGKLLSVLGDISFGFLGLRFDRYKILIACACAFRVLVVLLLLPLIARLKQADEGSDALVPANDAGERVDPYAGKEPA